MPIMRVGGGGSLDNAEDLLSPTSIVIIPERGAGARPGCRFGVEIDAGSSEYTVVRRAGSGGGGVTDETGSDAEACAASGASVARCRGGGTGLDVGVVGFFAESLS